MFDPLDHVPAGGDVARRGWGGKWTVARVSWQKYRWVMIQFAKYVAIEWSDRNSTSTIEEIVDAWLRERPA